MVIAQEGKITTLIYRLMNNLILINDLAPNTIEHTFDPAGNLIQLTQAGLGTSTYAYDALNRRITRTQGANVRDFHFFGASDLSDYETKDGALSASQVGGQVLNVEWLHQIASSSFKLSC